MSDFTETNRKYFEYAMMQIKPFLAKQQNTNGEYHSNLAASYKGQFADAQRMLSAETVQHRNWISNRWTDTEAGKDQEIKMLEYACGPGVISMYV
jgi:hypothetical protein